MRGWRGTLEERFWRKVECSSETGCWVWTGTLSGGGYGRFWDGTRVVQAMRVSYALVLGQPFPEGLLPDHLCRNRACVNPFHLEPVTHRENVLRGIGRTAVNAKATHCIHGHPFDEANTYMRPNGARQCRACGADAARRYKAARTVPA